MKFVFFKSKEHPDHYFIYLTTNGNNVEAMLQKWTHTGAYKDSGYEHMEIERGPEFISKHGEDFLDFLATQIATNHVPNTYNTRNYRAYYEFKTLDFAAWEKKFEEYQSAQRKQALAGQPQTTVQTTFNF